MIDTTNSEIRQLRVNGSPVEHWDQLIIYTLITRMPSKTLAVWEEINDFSDMPTLDDVLNFLGKRARGQLNQQ